MKLNYNIRNLIPYINWAYLYHAWNVKEGSAEAESLKADATKIIIEASQKYEAYAIVELYDCWAVDDDIQLIRNASCPCPQCQQNPEVIATIPFLRQQTPGKDGYCWCLSDFIRQKGESLRHDKIGIFATSVNAEMQQFCNDDPYGKMLAQTVADRLAEAAAERLHEQVRREIWGYAPQENLSTADLHKELFAGIRPAVGYPCLPDVSLNFLLDSIIDFSQIGISLTESAMMLPHSSVSGFMMNHPQSYYFAVGHVGEDQLRDYAHRRSMEVEEIRKYLK